MVSCSSRELVLSNKANNGFIRSQGRLAKGGPGCMELLLRYSILITLKSDIKTINREFDYQEKEEFQFANLKPK